MDINHNVIKKQKEMEGSVSLNLHNNIFFRSSSGGNQLQCSVCECWLPSSAEKFVVSHVNGRKHKQQVNRKKEKERKFQCSVFVKGFDPKLPDLEKELQSYFEGLGVQVADVYVDKNSTLYAIVELSATDDVNKVLESQRPLFHEKKLIVKRRETQKSVAPPVSCEVQTSAQTNTNNCLLPPELQTLLAQESDVNKQMEVMMQFYKLTDAEIELRQLICELLKNVLEEVYPQCDILLFGSSANGLGEHGCDVDLTLIANELDQHDDIYSDLHELVQRFVPGCKNVSIVHSVKTCSVVKFLHVESNLSVDLSVNNQLALHNTSLIDSYLCYNECVHVLVFIVRKWAKCFGFSGGHSSCEVNPYALTLMVIYYLQRTQPPLLPCLQECHDTDEKIIGEWNCSYCHVCAKKSQSPNKLSISQMLLGFFRFFSDFDYENNAICIHSNSVVNRRHAIAAVNSLDLGDAENDFKFASPLLVQDPFKRTHNLTHNVSADGLVALTNEFKRLASLCQELVIGKINLVDLFAEKRKYTKREKQRQKRNRSNMYTISLPNCQHTSVKSSDLCSVFIRKMLEVDLRMRLSEIEVDVEENREVEELKGVPVLDDDTEQLCKSSSGASSKKRAADTVSIELKPIKRAKLWTGGNMSCVATAYADTWTNRRKERRLIQKLIALQPEGENVMSSSEKQDDADSGIILDEELTSELDSAKEMIGSQPLLRFKVQVTKASTEGEVCKLKLEPIDGSRNVVEFQTFYCYAKKQLISIFK